MSANPQRGGIVIFSWIWKIFQYKYFLAFLFQGCCCTFFSAVKRILSQLDGGGTDYFEMIKLFPNHLFAADPNFSISCLLFPQVQSMMSDPKAVDKLQKIMQWSTLSLPSSLHNLSLSHFLSFFSLSHNFTFPLLTFPMICWFSNLKSLSLSR